jgi:hypothetical protein
MKMLMPAQGKHDKLAAAEIFNTFVRGKFNSVLEWTFFVENKPSKAMPC